MDPRTALAGLALVLVSAFAYPLGNRKMMLALERTAARGRPVRPARRNDAREPARVARGGRLRTRARAGWPQADQVAQAGVVALSSGIVATALFFAASDRVRRDPVGLAAVEATQAAEVPFTLAPRDRAPRRCVATPLGFCGLGVIVAGMIGYAALTGRLARSTSSPAARSGGIGASNATRRPVAGWSKARRHAWSACRPIASAARADRISGREPRLAARPAVRRVGDERVAVLGEVDPDSGGCGRCGARPRRATRARRSARGRATPSPRGGSAPVRAGEPRAIGRVAPVGRVEAPLVRERPVAQREVRLLHRARLEPPPGAPRAPQGSSRPRGSPRCPCRGGGRGRAAIAGRARAEPVQERVHHRRVRAPARRVDDHPRRPCRGRRGARPRRAPPAAGPGRTTAVGSGGGTSTSSASPPRSRADAFAARPSTRTRPASTSRCTRARVRSGARRARRRRAAAPRSRRGPRSARSSRAGAAAPLTRSSSGCVPSAG